MSKIFVYRFGPKTIEKEDLEFLKKITFKSPNVKFSEAQKGVVFIFNTELDLKEVFAITLCIYDDKRYKCFSMDTRSHEIRNNASFIQVCAIDIKEIDGYKVYKETESKQPKRFSFGPPKRKSSPKLYELDELLDLICEKGMDGLTSEQLKQLNNFSKNI